MKKIFCLLVVWSAVGGLFAQQDPVIRDNTPFVYVALETVGPYEQIPAKMNELMQLLQKQNVMMLGAPLGIYYNSPDQVKPEELKWELGVPVDAMIAVQAPLKRVEFSYPKVAEIIHRGPYASSAASYVKLFAFIGDNGYAVTGPVMETYYDDPAMVKPEDLRTLITVPVVKK